MAHQQTLRQHPTIPTCQSTSEKEGSPGSRLKVVLKIPNHACLKVVIQAEVLHWVVLQGEPLPSLEPHRIWGLVNIRVHQESQEEVAPTTEFLHAWVLAS